VQQRVARARQAGRQNVLMLIDGQQGMRFVPLPTGRG
jgi:hypothetical protein